MRDYATYVLLFVIAWLFVATFVFPPTDKRPDETPAAYEARREAESKKALLLSHWDREIERLKAERAVGLISEAEFNEEIQFVLAERNQLDTD